uniref:Chorismate-utilising enzyme C-terminal domain-containing protein n=1 Tax=Haptolina ericina TaxID=156174 RepID=A0A7S3EPM4_9EUKA
MAVETFATVHQLVSTIRGTLAPDLDALDVCAASFPPGSMTGAPKVRTMRLIDELEEGAPRGAYSGCLGFFSVHGAADLNVVIRTAVVSQQGVAIGAGGAVVDMSDARQEWEEVLLKARTPMRAVATCLAPEGLGVDVALGVGVG